MSDSVIDRQARLAGIRWEKTPGRRRPALWSAILLGSGIVLARHAALAPGVWAILLVVSLAVLLSLGRRHSAVLFIAGLSLWVALGAVRYASETQTLPAHHIANYLPLSQHVEIFGQVVDLPERRDYTTNLVLELKSIKADYQRSQVTGRVLVRIYDTTKHFAYGDYLRFSGKLEKPSTARNPGGFNYRLFLENRGIYGLVAVAKNRRVHVYPDPRGHTFINRLIIPLREHILRRFREDIPGIGGALLSGYLIGETRDMPGWLYRAYRDSGTLHLLAVSGSNVWLVLGLFWLVFRRLRFPRILQTILLLAILIVFCFITRNEPSVVRAGLMAGLILIGRLLYRRMDILNILGVSAVIILLVSPRHMFLAGFQLSYAAVLGIVVFVPRFLQLLPGLARVRAGRWLISLAGSSVAATAATAPILALHFGVVPIVSVAANLVMVPLAAVVTYAAIILLLVGDLWPWAAPGVAWVAETSAMWSIGSARIFESIPLGRILWPDPGVLGLFNYGLALVAVAASRYWFRWVKFALFYILAVAIVIIANDVFAPRVPAGEVAFLDCREEPLVAILLPDRPPRFVGTPGAFSPGNDQWVLEPFTIKAGLPREMVRFDTLHEETISRPPGDIHVAAPPAVQGIIYRRFCLESAGHPSCLVADYIQSPFCRILIVYQRDPAAFKWVVGMLADKRLDVLALRSGPPSADIRAILAGLDCHHLILFSVPSRYTADGVRETWARYFPGWTVLSTRADGGIRVPLFSSFAPSCTDN